MSLKINEVYHGFHLNQVQEIPELNSQGYIFTHQKSGARLLFLANDDDNKVFSISFRTPPEDSTGVAHILEHSVLCGSRKFPVKEPFVELVKGSLNTFLNAMTFSDKTMYPVASRNDKDFRNLMDVYLDAVFYPDIYKCPQILMQEGWHYDIDSKADDLSYKGVVYNEMKGVFSSPDAVLERCIQESLFPDTTYGVESGGDPDSIPSLTQQQFEDFHRNYYHPVNSYIFLYGNADIIEQLKFLDEEYLSHFNKIEVDSKITMQQPFPKTVEKVINYPISAEETSENKTFLSLNFVVGTSAYPESYIAFQILDHMLLKTPAAPLKKALLDAGIGQDVFGLYNRAMLQPAFTIAVKGANPDKKELFIKTVYQTLQKLVVDGLDKRLIESSINHLEFSLREANYGNYPKGLIYNIKCMDSWLYDESPFLHLKYSEPLEKVKTALTTKYFENIIEQYLMDNTHRSIVVLQPQHGLEEKRVQAVCEKLASYKASLTDEQIENLIEQTRALELRQTTPDSAENLKTIPLLSLKDINPQTEVLPLEEKDENGAKVLFHSLNTNKIAYMNFYFDTTMVPQHLLPYLYLLGGILGRVDTEKYAYAELSNEINIHTGGISFKADAFDCYGSEDVFYPKFVVKSKALVEKLGKLTELLSEITLHSIFTNKKRLQELVQELKSKMATNIMEAGHQVTASRVQSYFSTVAKYKEYGGLSFYQFIADLDKHFDDRYETLADNLGKIASLIFNNNGMLTSVTIDEQDYGKFVEKFAVFYDQLGAKKFEPINYDFELQKLNEGLMTSAKVQYVAKANKLQHLGYQYHGALKVLETVLKYDYLWNKVRVQGGAYGCFAQFMRNGNFVFGSYRDPNLTKTIAVYDDLSDYIKNFAVDEREMRKYIIGTMSAIDSPLTPSMKGERAAENYIRNITYKDAQLEREQILTTDQGTISSFAPMLKAAMEENYVCVLGNEDKIKQSKNVFNHINYVFE